MENELQIKSVGVKAQKRQTSRLDKLGVLPKIKTKNDNSSKVITDSAEKKKNENNLIQNTTDIKKNILLVPSKIKKPKFSNDVRVTSKDKTNFSDTDKKKEYPKNKIYEKKHNVDDITKLKKDSNILKPKVNVPEKTKKKETKLKLSDVKQRTEKITDKRNVNLNEKNTTIDKSDKFLKSILKKENVSVQTQRNEEPLKTKNDLCVEEVTNESSDEDAFNLDLIEQYKNKKQKETEKKKKEELAKRKAQLIKKKVLKDAETQVLLDDFTIFYEKVKPRVDTIVENILHKALKEIFEENELNKIRKKIHAYENIRIQKFESIKMKEEKNQDFYNEVQQKIKERIEIKKKVKTIIEKRIAHCKAKKNLQYIFQKNIDSYSTEKEILFNDFKKSAKMFILPGIGELIQHLMEINTNITISAVNEIIEKQVVTQNSEKCNLMKRLLLKERERKNDIFL